MSMRLDKFLTSQNICSRKEASKYAREKRLCVNGAVVKSADVKIDPESDIVSLDGENISYSEYVYIMLNKPGGVLSASNDKNAPTVIDLLSDDMRRRGLFPAGRLDKDTTGLLIITDDGEFAHRFLSPKYHVEKLYRAHLDRPLDDGGKASLEAGVTLSDGTKYRPAKIDFENEEDRTTVFVKITEGKFHEVKKMLAFVGCTVLQLERLRIGGLEIDKNLAPGEARLISEEELKAIFSGQNS